MDPFFSEGYHIKHINNREKQQSKWGKICLVEGLWFKPKSGRSSGQIPGHWQHSFLPGLRIRIKRSGSGSSLNTQIKLFRGKNLFFLRLGSVSIFLSRVGYGSRSSQPGFATPTLRIYSAIFCPV